MMDRKSFEDLLFWYMEITQYNESSVPIVLVGAKADVSYIYILIPLLEKTSNVSCSVVSGVCIMLYSVAPHNASSAYI